MQQQALVINQGPQMMMANQGAAQGVFLQQGAPAGQLAVAIYDLGEFVRFHPQGKAVCKNFGAKAVVMRLLGHPDRAVQKEALLCCSKMMVVNWEFIERSCGSGGKRPGGGDATASARA